MKDHENNEQRQGGPLESVRWKQVRSQGVPREYPDEWLELRWIRPSQTSLIPLLVEKWWWKTLCPGWDTHTHTHFFSSHISTHNFIYTPFLSHLTSAVAGAVSRDCRRGCGARCRRWGPGSLRSGRCSLQRLQKGLRRVLSPLGARLSPQWPAQSPETAEGAAARVVAAGAAGCPRGRRSLQSPQKGLRPLVPLAAFRVAGAVSRASRRGCGARCRRWCRWLSAVSRASRRGCGARCRRWRRWQSSWQAQSPEPPEGAAARVVAAGAAGCPRGRRSIQSLEKGLRRALSPLVPLAEGPAARVVAAGCLPRGRRSISRASRRACARVVAAGAACCPRGYTQMSPLVPLAVRVAGAEPRASRRGCAACCLPRGRRSIQSLKKGLWRALSPLVPLAAFLVAGAVSRASRRGCGARCRRWCRWPSSAWQAQSPEPPEGAFARVVAAGAAGCLPHGRRSIQLRRALSPLVPLAVRVAGAVSRASRRGCGARCRLSLWQAQSPEPPEGAVPLAAFRVAGAVYPEPAEGAAARVVAAWCRWLSSWQAQSPEPPEGAVARVVAAGAAGCLCNG